ncbi:MAG: hypothetical protein ACLSB9_25050, partial [Hydrogeniiclostridium mannosilyticum]
QYALGHEYAPVARWGDSPVAKSIGNSTTLPKNLVHAGELVPIIYMLCECVAERLRLAHLRAEVLHLWLRDFELSSQTRQIHLGAPTQVSSRLASACLLDPPALMAPYPQRWCTGQPVVLEKEAYQLSIFSMKEQKMNWNAVSIRCAIALGIVHRPCCHLQDTQLKSIP